MAFYWNPLGAMGVAVSLVAVALAAVVLATGPGRTQNRRLALALALEAGASFGGSGLLYVTDSQRIAFGSQGLGYFCAGWAFLAYLLFLGTLPAPLARPLRWRPVQASLATLGAAFSVLFLLRTDLFLSGVEPRPYTRFEAVNGPWLNPLVIWPGIATALLGFAVALSMWLQSPRGSQARRQGAAYAVAFGLRDANLAWFLGVIYILDANSATIVVAVNVVYAAYLVILAYAMLRHQLFDIQLRIKRTLRRGTLASAYVLAFLVVAKLTESWAEQAFGSSWVFGAVAAGLLLFALTPLQRAAERFADAAMPGVRETPEYLAFRKFEVYRAAVEELSVGGMTPKEQRALEALRAKLGIAPADAAALQREAAAGGVLHAA